jgi:hypothetical protein
LYRGEGVAHTNQVKANKEKREQARARVR